MVARDDDLRWGDLERARLVRAMKDAGHTQYDLAEELTTRYGADVCQQGTVSRWISGATLRPSCVDALHAYLDDYAPLANDSSNTDPGDTNAASWPAYSGLSVGSAAAGGPEFDQSNPYDMSSLQKELLAERRRSARLARSLETVSNELARVLEARAMRQ